MLTAETEDGNDDLQEKAQGGTCPKLTWRSTDQRTDLGRGNPFQNAFDLEIDPSPNEAIFLKKVDPELIIPPYQSPEVSFLANHHFHLQFLLWASSRISASLSTAIQHRSATTVHGSHRNGRHIFCLGRTLVAFLRLLFARVEASSRSKSNVQISKVQCVRIC